MYGKLINGRLVPAPNPLHINRGLVYNPSSYLYEAVSARTDNTRFWLSRSVICERRF